MRIFGRNNVAILATVFLLSYTKLLKTIFIAISFTHVLGSHGNTTNDQFVPHAVWFYDGNLPFLGKRHAILFVVSLLFLIFLFLPYTLLLTFGQCLRSTSLRWACLRRLKRSTVFVSVMDAYQAPYNARHRYWTGLMLLIRCVLFIAFTTCLLYTSPSPRDRG